MFTKTGKLLTTQISNNDLYEFSIRAVALTKEKLGENGQVAPYVGAAEEAVNEMDNAFSHSLRSAFTPEIKRLHKERVALLTALRRHIAAREVSWQELPDVGNPGAEPLPAPADPQM